MKAVVHDRYGAPDVLELTEIDQPVVGDDQVLVRVRAASLNPADWHFLRGLPYLVRLLNGLRKPRKATVLGSDLAGQIEAIGKHVRQFRPGDAVFGRTRAAHRPDPRAAVATGGCAEYACVSADLLVPKPANLTFEQAAAVPLAALTALQALRDAGEVRPGQQVLVNGASGGVGTFAVQLAKSFGAEVTGACSTKNLDMVGSGPTRSSTTPKRTSPRVGGGTTSSLTPGIGRCPTSDAHSPQRGPWSSSAGRPVVGSMAWLARTRRAGCPRWRANGCARSLRDGASRTCS
jgi:NADPH:quinone reductase-like Zn-dependent oxidoreductase